MGGVQLAGDIVRKASMWVQVGATRVWKPPTHLPTSTQPAHSLTMSVWSKSSTSSLAFLRGGFMYLISVRAITRCSLDIVSGDDAALAVETYGG